MTLKEQDIAIRDAAILIDITAPDETLSSARSILAPMFAKIAALEAENAKAQEDIYISRCDVGAAQKTASQCIDEIKHLRTKITALEAENATLRKRLVVDDAMMERAARGLWKLQCDRSTVDLVRDGHKPPKQWASPWHESGTGVRQQKRYLEEAKAALEAALGTEKMP